MLAKPCLPTSAEDLAFAFAFACDTILNPSHLSDDNNKLLDLLISMTYKGHTRFGLLSIHFSDTTNRSKAEIESLDTSNALIASRYCWPYFIACLFPFMVVQSRYEAISGLDLLLRYVYYPVYDSVSGSCSTSR